MWEIELVGKGEENMEKQYEYLISYHYEDERDSGIGNTILTGCNITKYDIEKAEQHIKEEIRAKKVTIIAITNLNKL